MKGLNGKRALVIEGGAMRGIFAAGVLDAFIDEDFFLFDFVMGVSAGSTNAIGYLAGDRQRSYKIITDHALRRDFFSFKRYAKGGHLVDVNWLWQTSREDVALNVDRYLKRGIPLWVVTTAVHNGEPVYHMINADNLDEVLPASCAMPVVYRDYPEVAGVPMSDGGVSDQIPVIEAYKRGARDITVLRSMSLSYRKDRIRFPSMYKPLLASQPNLLDAVLKRQDRYEDSIDFILNPPADCVITQITPPENFPVGRFTRSLPKLNRGYHVGMEAAEYYLRRQRLVRAS